MRACDKCRVTLEGDGEYCPLCQGETRGEPGEGRELFPEIPTVSKRYSLLFRWLMFGSAAAGVISVVINVLVPTSVWWASFVLLGIGSMWLTLAIVIHKRANILKTVLYQVVAVSLLAVCWDAATHWRGWSLEYVMPIVCTAAMIAMGVVARVQNLRLEDYVIYIVIDAVFGVVPAVCLFAGAVSVRIPSVFCVAGSVLSLSALFIFAGERIKTELRRRLHL